MNANDLLKRAAALLVPQGDKCDCEICSVGRDLRAAISTAQPDADTLRRWYQTLPADAVRSLVTARTVRSEARL